MDSPAPPYIPATWEFLALLGDAEWIGPAECYANGFKVRDHVDRWGVAPLDECIAWVQSEEDDSEVPKRVRLDCRRREVQHLICDRFALPDSQRSSEFAAALAWWTGTTGRVIQAILPPWEPGKERTHPEFRCDPRAAEWSTELWAHGWHIFGVASATFWGGQANGPETGDAGKAAADQCALDFDCAIINEVDGRLVLTLPSLHAGEPGIVWSQQ